MARNESARQRASSQSSDRLRQCVRLAVAFTLVVGLLAAQGVGVAASDVTAEGEFAGEGPSSSPFGECGFLDWLLSHVGVTSSDCVSPAENEMGSIGP